MNTYCKTGTTRQEIIKLLEQFPCTLRDISQVLRISEKEVVNHLPYISKSLKPKNKKLIVTPYRCCNCNYHFEERIKYKKPGKCPKCRMERIEPAQFGINSL